MEEKPKSVGIWIRVSTEDQAKGESPEHHEKRARGYAEFKGWKVKEVYHLEGVSGKSVMEHPEAKRMLQGVKNGHISALIFSKLARLARNTRELLDFADTFREYKADLVSLQEEIDTSSPAGRLFFTMIAALSQWEREEIASRVAASVPIRAKLGKPLGGAGPFGYRWVDKKLTPHPKEALIRKLMHELFLEHKRTGTVADILNERGYRSRENKKFNGVTVKRLLLSPTAKGLHRMNYTSHIDGKTWGLKPKEDWVYIEVEPIISEELWNQCNYIFEERRKNGKKPAKKTVHLFAGFLYCHCGQKMYVPSRVPKYLCYKCRNKIPIQDMENIFQERLKSFLLSSEDIAGYLEGANNTIKEKEELLETLGKERDKIRAEMDKTYRLYLDDQINSHGFGEKNKPMEERLSQINDQIPELQGEIDFLKIRLRSSDQVLSEAKDLYLRWKDLSEEDKRNVVENVAEKIVVDTEQVTINLRGIPPPSEMMTNSEQTPHGLLPFCHIALKIKKPQSDSRYPKTINTLGDHVRRKRLDMGITQMKASEMMGVSYGSLREWERNKYQPWGCSLLKVYAFLGYCPWRPVDTLPKKLTLWRESLGLTRKQLSARVEIQRSTIARWERGASRPWNKSLKKLMAYFSKEFGEEVKI